MSSTRESIKLPYKNAHSSHMFERSLPSGAVSLGVLKSVERELSRRSMLEAHEGVTPLWFLAETERNIFLWRNGKSIDDHLEFDFWIDVPSLISKRKAQLDKPQGLNPFVNPLWGGAPLDENLLERELRYLEEFEDLADIILPHAEALSHASREVRHELDPQSAHRITVVLPAKRPKK